VFPGYVSNWKSSLRTIVVLFSLLSTRNNNNNTNNNKTSSSSPTPLLGVRFEEQTFGNTKTSNREQRQRNVVNMHLICTISTEVIIIRDCFDIVRARLSLRDYLFVTEHKSEATRRCFDPLRPHVYSVRSTHDLGTVQNGTNLALLHISNYRSPRFSRHATHYRIPYVFRYRVCT
jgi:hypothetical protein